MKPLNKKAYGSIPHLLGSKLGEGDHHCHEGQHRICTEKTRDKHDLVIVQEKYDGSNVAVANIDGRIVALTRRGYTAESSPFAQHHYFAKWVEKNRRRFNGLLSDGDRVCGEWLLQAHGVRYSIPDEPFIAFDYFVGEKRLCYGSFSFKVEAVGLTVPRLLAFGHCAYPIAHCLEQLFTRSDGWITAEDKPEGLVYRVERKEKFDFIAKYVRPDFVPGAYFPEVSGRPELFNVDLNKLLE